MRDRSHIQIKNPQTSIQKLLLHQPPVAKFTQQTPLFSTPHSNIHKTPAIKCVGSNTMTIVKLVDLIAKLCNDGLTVDVESLGLCAFPPPLPPVGVAVFTTTVNVVSVDR